MEKYNYRIKMFMEIDFSKNWLLLFDDSIVSIDLPYDAMIHEKRYKECSNGEESAFFPGKKYIYRKEFSVDKKDNKYFAFRFEGVYRNASVKLNGEVVGNNKYGFSEFVIDISDVVKEENVLEVEVDNSLTPNARFYTGSGIYRPVYLIVKKEKEIENIKISTVDYKNGVINVDIESQKGVNVKIFDNDQIIYSGRDGLITIPHHKLWDEDNPYLYKLIVSTENDEESLYFGIRDISFIEGKGFFVNGKETKLRGACIHSDNGILGASSYKEIDFNKIRLLKEAGFNAIRSAHNPCSRYILEACDKYGVYIMDELYDGWYTPKNYHDHARDFSKEEYQKDIYSMVNKDFNHPSVILYSLGNEVSEVAHQKGLDTLKDMTDCIHSLDDTRKVTCGINLLICVYEQLGMGIYKDKKEYKPVPLEDKNNKKEKKSGSSFFNYWTQKLGKTLFMVSKGRRAEKIVNSIVDRLDIIGLNYGSSRYEIDYKKHPNRLMIGTESFINDAPYNYQKMKEIPTLIGDFIWVGFDYLGEAGFGDWTYYSYGGLPLTYGTGTFDLIGNKTALLSYMQVVWGLNDKPVIAVRPVNHYNETPKISAWKMTNAIESYNFHDYVNKKMTVEIYSKAPYVQLYQNDKLLGTKKTKNYIAIFKGKYQPGTLLAIGLDEHKKEINRSKIYSKDNKAHINAKLLNNTKTIQVGHVLYGNVEILNNDNQLLPCYEKQLSVETSNNLLLIALGSGLSNNKEDYVSNTHHAYQGRLAFALKGKEKGKGYIKISGQDVRTVEIEIEIKEEL